MKGLLIATRLFPSSFKNILAGKQGGVKKDNVTQVLENLIKLFLPLGPSGATVVDIAAQLLCILYKSRDKPRAAFREWLQRVLSNVVLYLNAMQPRYFDEKQLSGTNQEIEMQAVGFEFIFDNKLEAARLDKLTFKDVASEQVGACLAKIEFLFRLLKYTIEGGSSRSKQYSGEGINFLTVDLNLEEVFLTL